MVKEMKPRHDITLEYESNLSHQRRWKLTVEWLKQFDIKGKGLSLDCGDWTPMTTYIMGKFKILMINSNHNLDSYYGNKGCLYDNAFVFEVIEHLLNPLVFMTYLKNNVSKKGYVYLSTPIFRPKFMRNKECHFHEFNYNELCHLIDVAGFKIVNEKIINQTRWYYAFTGFRPLLRVLGFGRTILLRLKRK